MFKCGRDTAVCVNCNVGTSPEMSWCGPVVAIPGKRGDVSGANLACVHRHTPRQTSDPSRNVKTKKQVYRLILNHQRLYEFLLQNNGRRWQCNLVAVFPVLEEDFGCDCVDGSFSSDTDLASTTRLESCQVLQIRCKFGTPSQNRGMAEAVLTITLTQHSQCFNTWFLQSNTEFYHIPLLRHLFHTHTVTNAQLWQHECKFLSLSHVTEWWSV